MIFDSNFDFTRKARLVERSHPINRPSELTYVSVVSRDSIRIFFLISVLNKLDSQMKDVGNAYLKAHTKENVMQ